MTVEEIIAEVDKLLDSEEKWTQKALARDSNGVATFPWAGNARCWCLSGALWKVVGGKNTSEFLRVRDFLRSNIQGRSGIGVGGGHGLVTYFNDHPQTTFEDIKAVLKWNRQVASG